MQKSTSNSFLHRAVLSSLILFIMLPASAQTFDFEPIAPRIGSARLAAIGGPYVALEAGFETLSTNPAALAYVSKTWSVSKIEATVSGPIFDLPSIFKSDDVSGAMLDLVADNNGLYFGSDITGPLAFGKVDRNYGFGIFNRTIAVADVPSLSYARLLVGEEFLMVGGYGISVYQKEQHDISIGLQLKGFFQIFVTQSGSAVSVINTITDANIDALPSVLSTGFGVDMGAMYRYGDQFTAGVVCKDVFTPVFSNHYEGISAFINGNSSSKTQYDRLSPDLSVGVTYNIPLPTRWNTVSNWKVLCDYRDVLCFLDPLYRNPILNLAIGTEIVLLDVVSLRIGIHETYLATGIGLDASIFTIDFAMYGSEMGIEPGEQPVLNIALSLGVEL